MKSFFLKPLWVLSLITLTQLLYSCKSSNLTSNKSPKVENYTFANSLLWQIEGNGMTTPSYLFGTIHMIDDEDFFWPKGVLASIDVSDKLVFEIDMDDMFDMSKAMSLMTQAFMKDGATLEDYYSEEDYDLVKGHFEDLGIPFFMLKKMKPMFLTVFASGDITPGEGIGGDIKSYEMELYSIAQESKKEVLGLETIEYQMSVFDSIPYQEQANMLLQTIKTSDSEDDAFKEMIDMYVSQNINKMVSSMSEEEGISGHEDVLLYNRNKNWIPIMSEMMSSVPTFFAVGAGHLGGKDGVLDLLRKKGYKLTPLSLENI